MSSTPKGKYIREIGEGLYGFAFAHAVRVDPQDNIWAVDEGTNMVIKFNPEGRVLMVLGRRPEAIEGLPAPPAMDEPYLFNRPTDVGWDAAGNIFVTDGYGNSRVVKYDKNGRFLKTGGDEGLGAGAAQSAAHDGDGRARECLRRRSQQQPHSGVRQRSEAEDDLRSGGRAVGDVHLARAAPVSCTHRIRIPTTTTRVIAAVTGEIYKMELDGTILGKFGKAGKGPGEFSSAHELDCRNPNEILVAEITSWRVQKIFLHPPAAGRLP